MVICLIPHTQKKPFNTDVFIEFVPMDTSTPAANFKTISLLFACMKESRKIR